MSLIINKGNEVLKRLYDYFQYHCAVWGECAEHKYNFWFFFFNLSTVFLIIYNYIMASDFRSLWFFRNVIFFFILPTIHTPHKISKNSKIVIVKFYQNHETSIPNIDISNSILIVFLYKYKYQFSFKSLPPSLKPKTGIDKKLFCDSVFSIVL